MTKPVDLVLQIETGVRSGQPAWRVQVGTAREFSSPLTDDDLRKAIEAATPAGQPPALPPRASTWDGLLAHLAPNAHWRPNARDLELIGKLLHDHLLHGKVAEHVKRMEDSARARRVPLRYVVNIFEGEEDGLLRRLPFELLHHGSFWFRRADAVGVRLPPGSEACDVRLAPGACVLIAAAHADDRDPSADQLAAHVAAIAKHVEEAGFAARSILECTPAALESALQDGCDVLYVVCHGEEDLDLHGRLALRGGDVTGRQLGEWLEAADAAGRRLQAALLCACSSSVPGRRPGTMGMAEHLAATGRRAQAALGFRAPVKVSWALDFTTEVFVQLSARKSLEAAVASARRKQPVGDSQWSLPLMFAHERDPFAITPHHGPALEKEVPFDDAPPPVIQPLPPSMPQPAIQTLLPTAPRPYFTARQDQLGRLRAWRASSTTPPCATLVGEGGVGKSELARVFAHKVHGRGRGRGRSRGWPVIWLERPDRDLAGCLTTMIRQHDPGYRPPDGATFDDLRAAMTRALGPHIGLLVLDDVEDVRAVDTLTPGDRWKVLVTTRQHALVPGATEIDVEPLAPDDALALLAKLTREGEPFPPDEVAAARALVLALACLPLAIEVAGALIRRGASLEEARLAALSGDGDESVLGRVSRVMERSLAGLEPGDEAAWTLIAALGTAGVTAQHIAAGLEEPEGRAARRLFRLRQANLVRFQPATARYTMHPLARQVARTRAQAKDTWDTALSRAAHVAYEIMRWCREPVNHNFNEAYRRWLTQRDLVETLEIGFWPVGNPAADTIAKILSGTHIFRLERLPVERLQILDEALVRAQSPEALAHSYLMRGDLRKRLADLKGAEADNDRAIAIYSSINDLLGLANALYARGTLRDRNNDYQGAEADYERSLAICKHLGNDIGCANAYRSRSALKERRNDLQGAEADLEQAFKRYAANHNDLGLAHVHLARGDLRRRRHKLDAADIDYDCALSIYTTMRDRLGMANVYRARGDLRVARDDLAGAQSDYDRAIEMFTENRNNLGLASAHRARGNLQFLREHLDGAHADYDRAIEISSQTEDSNELAHCHSGLGDIQRSRGKLTEADAEYTLAINLYTATHDDLGLAYTLLRRGMIRQKLHSSDEAEADYNRAAELFELTQDSAGLANTYGARGTLRRSRGDLTGAEADFLRASDLFAAAGDAIGQTQAGQALAALRASAKPAG